MNSENNRNSDFRPLKRLSQNFLRDKNIGRKIVSSIEAPDSALIVEIGPGSGMLTQFLIQKFNRVVAVELDSQLAQQLPHILGDPDNLEVIQHDFLDLDIQNILRSYPNSVKILVGNLPYHITSPIIFRVLDNFHFLNQCIFMVQKEVGQRIVSNPGSKDYGILSVFCQFYAQTNFLFTVPSHLFAPQPTVDSAVIRLTFIRDAEERLTNPNLFKKIVRHTFGQRRKMLRNTLSKLYSQTILNELKLDLTRRPETLSVEEFINVANQLYQITADM